MFRSLGLVVFSLSLLFFSSQSFADCLCSSANDGTGWDTTPIIDANGVATPTGACAPPGGCPTSGSNPPTSSTSYTKNSVMPGDGSQSGACTSNSGQVTICSGPNEHADLVCGQCVCHIAGTPAPACPNNSNGNGNGNGNGNNNNSNANTAPEVQACTQASTDSRTACGNNGIGATIGRSLMAGSQGFSAGMGGTFNAQAMCNAQEQQAAASFLANSIAATSCIQALDSCTSECDSVNQDGGTDYCGIHTASGGPTASANTSQGDAPNCITSSQSKSAKTKSSTCSSSKIAIFGGASVNALQIMQARAAAQACTAAFAAASPSATPPLVGCLDPINGPNNPLCPAYCQTHPGSPLPQCTQLAQNCSNPALSADTPGCPNYCQFHTTDPTCAQAPSYSPPPTSPNTPIAAGAGSDTGTFAPPTTGNETNGGQFTGYTPGAKGGGTTGTGNDQSGGGGGGGLGGSGGGSPFVAPIQNGQQGAASLKDIEHGLTSGSGGSGYSVSGIPTEGAGGRAGGGNGNGNGNGKENLNLAAFLPGGANDPNAQRGLAGTGTALEGLGITKANDLSNFEKVSRMMRKKQPYLVQGNGK